MSIITKILKQDAIYWAPTGGVDKFGKPKYSAPVEISCRWEDVHKEVLNSEGDMVHSGATVYVSQDVTVKGKLKLGSLSSSTPADPADADEAWEVLRFEKLPNFKVTEYLRTAYVQSQRE